MYISRESTLKKEGRRERREGEGGRVITTPCVLNSAKYCLQAPVRVRTEDTTSVKDSFPP